MHTGKRSHQTNYIGNPQIMVLLEQEIIGQENKGECLQAGCQNVVVEVKRHGVE